MTRFMKEHIRQSNLIEGIDDPKADADCLVAWNYLIGHDKIKASTLKHLHYHITKHQTDLTKAEKGKYRKVDVQVGGRLCPPPYLAHELMHNFIADMQVGIKHLDPKDMHIRFEKIHPFIDGNGRTGRMLMWWHELMQDKEPTLIKKAEVEDYYAWFK